MDTYVGKINNNASADSKIQHLASDFIHLKYLCILCPQSLNAYQRLRIFGSRTRLLPTMRVYTNYYVYNNPSSNNGLTYK